MAESYGWVVDDSDAWDAYEFACDYFGEDELNKQIVGSMSSEELAACLAFIFRMNDFRAWEERNEDEELEESVSLKESKGNNWRGCKNIQMVSHGSWGDPDLVYDGYTFNYWDIEDALWNEFLEDEGITEKDTYVKHGNVNAISDEYEEKFDEYCQYRAEDYLDDVIAGGYFEDGKKTWHESRKK
jgi:hypothetical protein